MRTNAGHCREDMNIEDIHCQIVMRRQRNNQILRELEGGESEMFGGTSHNNLYEQAGENDTFISRHNSVNKTGTSLLDRTGEHNQTCVQVIKEVEILGPDYCSKRPIFLPLHFPDMLVQQSAQQQAQQEPSNVLSAQSSKPPQQ